MSARIAHDDTIKNAVILAPVLVQPDPEKPYTTEMDSSDLEDMIVLCQEGADGKTSSSFDGRKLQGAELNYPMHEKELLAIKDGLKKWYH
jgi:hypothetical protein